MKMIQRIFRLLSLFSLSFVKDWFIRNLLQVSALGVHRTIWTLQICVREMIQAVFGQSLMFKTAGHNLFAAQSWCSNRLEIAWQL